MSAAQLQPALVGATLVLLLCTALPLLRLSHWSVRALDFPRLQLAFLACLLLLAQWLTLDVSRGASWALLLVAAGCLAWQLWWILPYTPLWRAEVRPAPGEDHTRRLRILTANVLQSNRNAQALLDLVREYEPDVLVTMESDRWWQERLDQLQDSMPHSIKCPLDNLYGMHVYSRLPLAHTETAFLVEDDVPSMHCLLTLRDGTRVRMHFLHPAPPSPTENEESAERDAELVIVARSVAGTQRPVVVTGDLNDVAWSPTTRLFRKLSGLLDPRVGRGMFNTFHAGYPFLRWPLDHLFHSRHFTLRDMRRLPKIGSDHFALLTELVFTPGTGQEQAGMEADEADWDWAQSIAQEKDVSYADVPRPAA
tara:strand:- start:2489 stop:3586 length:1098 start_codon:yes stop_codon:yes gene_type:complete